MNHSAVFEQTIADLKEDGIRMTEQRRSIISYIIASRAHPTVEEIYNDLVEDFPGMSLATVYNTIRMLQDKGYVKEIQFGVESSRFDFFVKGKNDHYHGVCSNCGIVVDIDSPINEEINEAIQPETDFLITGHDIIFQGICADCQALMKKK